MCKTVSRPPLAQLPDGRGVQGQMSPFAPSQLLDLPDAAAAVLMLEFPIV